MRLGGMLAAALITAASLVPLSARAAVAVEDGWFIVNGERFFVKGIGYTVASGRGGIPWDRTFDPERVEHDIALIKAAGFNTVRNWNEYKVGELELFQKHGLMVIQGSWFSMERYLIDPAYAREAQGNLTQAVRTARAFDTILFHTITNEPHMDKVLRVGLDAYYQACNELKAVARREDPTCRVTFSHMSANELLDQSMWDVTFFNSYMYGPNTVAESLGYRGHIEWLMKRHGGGRKPFVIGEFGLSVSPEGPGKMGYGGNTPEEQRDGCLAMLQGIIDAGAQGGCLFHWRDGWFKFDDAMVHAAHPEEWYGILGVEDETSDPRGTPRPVYQAFREYNQMIVTEPRRMVVYPGAIPVQAFVTENVAGVRCRLGNGPWIEMTKRSPSWWMTDLPAPTEGVHRVLVEARLDLDDIQQISRSIDLVAGDPERALPALTLNPDRTTYAYGDTAVARVRSAAPGGDPLPNTPFTMTYRNHATGEERVIRGTTDAQGRYETPFPLFTKPTLITLGVGADVSTQGVSHHLSAAAGIEVAGLSYADVTAAAANKGRLIAGFDEATEDTFAATCGRVLGGAASFSVDRTTTDVKQGSHALQLHIEPEAPNAWGYTEILFGATTDISGDRAISVWLHGDGSGHRVKVLLIDADRERWLDEEIPITFEGWQRIVFGVKGLARDPFDGIADGDSHPNPEKLAGVAFAVQTADGSPAIVLVDDIRAHE